MKRGYRKFNNVRQWAWDSMPYTVFTYKSQALRKEGVAGDGAKLLRFDSKMEYNHYLRLLLLEQAGHISDIKHHPFYILMPGFKVGDKKFRVLKYEADFSFMQDGVKVIQDVKGVQTDTFKVKWLLVHRQHFDEIEAGKIRFELVEEVR